MENNRKEERSRITLYLDNELQPIAELTAPVQFDLDTRKLTDGEHTLKLISKSPGGREGVRSINFIVRNGPAIAIEGLKENGVVDGVIPIMINAYDKGDQKKFIIEGSETPQSVPNWLWIIVVGFIGWGAYYLITSLSQ